MSRSSRILLITLVTVVCLAIVIAAAVAVWLRPGRLGRAQCVELVRRAWTSAQGEAPSTDRELEFVLGRYRHRTRASMPPTGPIGAVAERLRDLFPQHEPDEDFFSRVKVVHRGRARVANRWCERVRLSPAGYAGHSLELWIDPASGHALGWRRLGVDGGLIRGYRVIRALGLPVAGRAEPRGGGEVPEGREGPAILPDAELVPPEELLDMAERGGLLLPQRLPPGFKLVGGRSISRLEPMEELRGMVPGVGMGRMRGGQPGPEGPYQGVGQQFQTIYSDGLNTISVVQYRFLPIAGFLGEPGRMQDIIRAKGKEVDRIFHTAMTGRAAPGALVLLFGEVSAGVLEEVAESIDLSRLERLPIPPSEFAPPPDGDPGRRPGFRGPFGRPHRPPERGPGFPAPPGDPE